MVFHTLPVTGLETNCYLLSREGAGALVIDAGGEAQRILARLAEQHLRAEWIVATHGHGDHIGANKELRRAFPEVKIAVGAEDARRLTSAVRNLSVMMGQWITSPPADRVLADGDVFEFQDLRFRVIGLPGHTPGGICLYADPPEGGAPMLFSGDTLFAGGIGRSDIPGGDGARLLEGIRSKLLVLPGDTRVYPGHGPATTIDRERRTNPWL